MKHFLFMLALIVIPAPLGANTCIAAKNPVRASAVCGHLFDPAGEYVANVELELINDSDEAVVSSVTSDEHGRFMFPAVPKGMYDLRVKSKTWQLYSPVKVTGSKRAGACRHPLEVKLSLGSCGSGISKKGYHPKY